MKTEFLIDEKYKKIFMECADEYTYTCEFKPVKFARIMKNNIGTIGVSNGGQYDSEGLELRNPIVVAIGDSVTAGHFESLLPDDEEELQRLFQEAGRLMKEGKPLPPAEITDARECYLEKFRSMLIDKYKQTSVSVINAGIAGDNLKSMSKRLYRDVIRYHPDLVIINGALNWDSGMGTIEDYRNILEEMVDRIKMETDADIVLLTPNGDAPKDVPGIGRMGSDNTEKRVEVIRQVAWKKRVCLVDVYSIWESAKEKGCPWEKLLANGINHPDKTGHRVYAKALMEMMEVTTNGLQ